MSMKSYNAIGGEDLKMKERFMERDETITILCTNTMQQHHISQQEWKKIISSSSTTQLIYSDAKEIWKISYDWYDLGARVPKPRFLIRTHNFFV